MVSLNGDGREGHRQRGGIFFSEPSVLQSPEDEDLLITHHLQTEEECHFKKCNTLWVAVCQIILIVLFLAGSIVLPYVIEPHIHPNETKAQQLDDAFTYVAFAQPAMWLLLLIIDRYLQYKHIVLRRYGYLDFTQNTRYIRRTTEFMFSLGNAAMLVAVMLCYMFIPPSNSFNLKAGTVYGVYFQQIIIGIESIVALFCCLRYAVFVYKFNSAKLAPDVEHEEQMIAVMQPSTHLPDVGYRDSQYVDSLLERQADMIRYLKHHTEHLSKRILKLRSAQTTG
ncbi:transmembrane protein 192-like [Asterias rubens]|uniref:transmembrane protein 192-like n=1 Tax=Asterias rubens TaxID=7604 RepID=UPI0014552638|nr:transmembrane protein 192-like [Asterias rubens]